MNKESVIYPYTEWSITEEKFDPAKNLRSETMFSLANGYIGMRGNFEEGLPGAGDFSVEGSYINGFYESEPITYPEGAYGFARNSQTMLNVANGKKIGLLLDGEEVTLMCDSISGYSRVLNLKDASLTRSFVYTSPTGKSVKVKIKRLVSLTDKHIALIRYEVMPLDSDANIRLISSIDGNVTNISKGNDPRVGSGLSGRVLEVKEMFSDPIWMGLRQKTHNTGFSLACAASHRLLTDCSYSEATSRTDLEVSTTFDIQAVKGSKIILEKYISYLTYRECEESNLLSSAGQMAVKAAEKGFDAFFKEQADYMADFWNRADVEIEGNAALQQGIRVNIFHLLQSVGRDGITNIAAKGLTGEGYEGHYFWDTEIYVLPFFLYSFPEISRKLLEYRYNTLDSARERARELAHPKGALFPWRTIGGEECSAYFPAGTAQYHINADIAYAVQKYMDATDDQEFLLNYGAEILFETARIWADLGAFIEEKGNKFCINTVTGPDEYTAIVNNNCYTNMMAAEHMDYAHRVYFLLKDNYPGQLKALSEKIGLDEEEALFWKTASDNMYIPYVEERKLYPQDDSFLSKKPWDFENTPRDKYPLLLNFHPLVIYRHQVCKQADLVLALFLLGKRFTREEKIINFDYYEKVTTHDSSLSPCIFSIMASEIGDAEKAYKYFMDTARTDLDDLHGNTANGIHTANMAGAWMCIINGFAGLRAYDNELRFDPTLPQDWEGYRFKISYKGRLISVSVKKGLTVYELLEGDSITFRHRGEEVFLDNSRKLCLS